MIKTQWFTSCLFTTGLLTILLFGTSAAAEMDHTLLIKTYTGSKTCISCHYAEVNDVAESIHYRLMGDVQGVYNMFTNRPENGPQGKGNRY